MGGPPGALPSKEKISAGRKEGDDHFKKKTLHPPFTDLQWGVSTCSNTSTRGERFLLPNHTLVFVPRSDSLVNKKAIPTLLAHTHTHSLYESMKIFSEISKETGGLTPPPFFVRTSLECQACTQRGPVICAEKNLIKAKELIKVERVREGGDPLTKPRRSSSANDVAPTK